MTSRIANLPPGLLGGMGSFSTSSSLCLRSGASESVSSSDVKAGEAVDGALEPGSESMDGFDFVDAGRVGLVTLLRGPKVRVCWVARADLLRFGGMVLVSCVARILGGEWLAVCRTNDMISMLSRREACHGRLMFSADYGCPRNKLDKLKTHPLIILRSIKMADSIN